jgi:hypothetical protein
MAVNKILRSTVSGHVPPSLQSGQVAINEADGIFFWLDADGTTIHSFNFKSPTAPTPTAGDNSTKVATTAFVAAAIAAIVNSAPGALDTLNELAAALGDDANFATTVNNALALRLRFDAVQSLTAGQKAQALANLGITGVVLLSQLASVATSGAYSDLSGRPANATAAQIMADTGAGGVVTTDQLWAAAAWQDRGSLGPGANLSLDTRLGLNQKYLVTGNITVGAVTYLIDGQSGAFSFKQDGTGGHNITFSGWSPIGQTAPPVNTAPNGLTYISWHYEAGVALYYSGGKV